MEKLLAILAILFLTASSPTPPVIQHADTTFQSDSVFHGLESFQDSTFIPRPWAMILFVKRHRDKSNEFMPWAVNYRQPMIYDVWWKEISSCLKLKLPADYKQTQFVMINQETFVARDNIPADKRIPLQFSWATTYNEYNQIFMGLSSVLRKSVVKHEMAHMLIYWNGVDVKGPGGDHPTKIFDGHCGITETST